MRFPKRISKHIAESESFRVMSSWLPKEWIIRDVTERDYGIDVYVEIVEADQRVTGKMIALQLKSRKSLRFDKSGTTKVGGINVSTCNYWHSLPIPVFLVVVDGAARVPYWLCVSWDRDLLEQRPLHGFDFRSVSSIQNQCPRYDTAAYTSTGRLGDERIFIIRISLCAPLALAADVPDLDRAVQRRGGQVLTVRVIAQAPAGLIDLQPPGGLRGRLSPELPLGGAGDAIAPVLAFSRLIG